MILTSTRNEAVYSSAKAELLGNGIPNQFVTSQKIQVATQPQWTPENIALACYAKTGGTPWVVASESSKRELIIGISRAQDHIKQFVVGFVTLVTQDGDFLFLHSLAPQPIDWRQDAYVNVETEPSADFKARILERLVELGNRVPAQVDLGYHLCYGDAGHRDFKEPEDTTNLVEVANALSSGVKREINWIHMPVPRNRRDAYFEPLSNLKLHPETELYLGLVHFTDGVEGTRHRIATAQRVVSDFGVATECGLGRRPAATIPGLLRIHSEVAAPILA